MDSSDAEVVAAKSGSSSKVGRLLQSYRGPLLIHAKARIGRRLRSKVSASDVVQEALLEAHRQFPNFQGQSRTQLTKWVQAIFAGTLANVVRRYFQTDARDLRRERPLSDDAGLSSTRPSFWLADPASSPSAQAERREETVIAHALLGRLSDDYATVIRLRHVEGLTFAAIAARMGRSVDSVEKLWMRGLKQLRSDFAREVGHD